MTARLAVFASGGGSNLQSLIDFFGQPARAALVSLVVSNREDAGALDRARDHLIPYSVVSPDDSAAMLRLLAAHSIDFIVLAGYLRQIPAAIVQAYPRRIVNIHPGPLPEFGGKGMFGERVHAAVLGSGRGESAVSIHFVDNDYDRGPLIAQYPVAVEEGDTPESLGARVLEFEHILYPRIIEAVIATESLAATRTN